MVRGGWLVAILAWALHVGALARAPLSIVQAVLSGGLVFLAVLAERFFDLRLGRWQWFGVTITAAGLAIIGLTGSGAARPQHSSLAALIAVEGAVFAVGAALLAISAHRRVLHRAEGLLLGLAAGALFGVSDVAIKYLTHAEGALHGLLSPWTATALARRRRSRSTRPRAACRSDPASRSSPSPRWPRTWPPSSAASSSSASPIGSGPLAIGARFVAFCLVIAGAALMPVPPRRAARAGHGPAVGRLGVVAPERSLVSRPGRARDGPW